MPSEAPPELVNGLALGRVGIAGGEARDARPQVPLGAAKLAAAQMPAAERQVAARVARVAAQRLAPVRLRHTGGVAVLLEMQAGEEEFVALATPPVRAVRWPAAAACRPAPARGRRRSARGRRAPSRRRVRSAPGRPAGDALRTRAAGRAKSRDPSASAVPRCRAGPSRRGCTHETATPTRADPARDRAG